MLEGLLPSISGPPGWYPGKAGGGSVIWASSLKQQIQIKWYLEMLLSACHRKRTKLWSCRGIISSHDGMIWRFGLITKHLWLINSFQCSLSGFAWISVQVGERQQVLVTEESFDGQYYVAHNKFYEQVRKLLSIPSTSVNFQRRLYSTQTPLIDFGRKSS